MDESRPREFTVTVEASLGAICYGARSSGWYPGGETLHVADPWRGDTAVRAVHATLPFGRPDHRRSQTSARRAPFAASRAVPGAARRFRFARVRREAPCFLRPPICYFSGKGLPCALSHASDSTAAHCYATIAARRHIGTEPKP